MSEKLQVSCLPKPPNGTHHRKGEMATWAFSRLWRVSGPTLLQVTLVAALLATVLGECGPPPVLNFAAPIHELNQTEFPIGTAVSYTCRPGYSRTSSASSVVCKSDGSWSYNFFCVKRRCSNPGDLPNGRVKIKTDFSFGSQIEFSCSEGYMLVGSTTSYCDIRDKGVDWSNPFPVCLIVKCEPPPDISHGKHNGGDQDFYPYGSSVTYNCDPKFSLIGNASIFCTVVNKTTGIWSPNPPTCENIICPQPRVPHGKIISGFGPYSYKDSIMFSCQRGFSLKGSNSIRCEADNKWYPSPPICEPICCPVPEVKNGRIIPGRRRYHNHECAYGYEDTLTYLCYEQNQFSATCQSDGTWGPKTPSCDQGCDFPPTIAHGHYKKINPYNVFRYDIAYECDKGYQLVGRATISCANSQWSHEAPQCKALCLRPEIENGKLSVVKEKYLAMESVTVQCDSGFGMVGSQRITCSENRTWYPEAPKCEWEIHEGCNQVLAGRKLTQCLQRPTEVKMALEVYKLSLEIELLELQIDKARGSF